MTTNRNEDGYHEFHRERRSLLKWALWGLAAIIGISLVVHVLGTFATVATAPSRVGNKTLQTDNIIHNYEWFWDTSKAFNARVGQIRSHAKAMEVAKADGANRDELARYRVELEGMRQSCRDIAARYNANASKVNRNIFRGPSTPESLNDAVCNS